MQNNHPNGNDSNGNPAEIQAKQQDNEIQSFQAEVPITLAGSRLDQCAAELFPDFSRSRLKSWIEKGKLTVNGSQQKPKFKLVGGEQLQLAAELEPATEWLAEDIPLDIVFQDEHLLVINKPAGLVVHPAAGHGSGTLMNALLFHDPEARKLPRAGIVHRLDKDTSGLMVVARSLQAHSHLVEQLANRTVSREYEAICQGVLVAGGTVDAPIGRHPVDRKKMAVVTRRDEFGESVGGKQAISHYRVLHKFPAHTYVQVFLETGRTHQIRVHMAYLKHPLVGDSLYAGRQRVPAQVSESMKHTLREFPRQALHARALTLIHPETGEEMCWESDTPDDMAELLEALEQDAKSYE